MLARPTLVSPALLASRPCRLTSRAFCLICAGIKGGRSFEEPAIEDSRRRGTGVVVKEATVLCIALTTQETASRTTRRKSVAKTPHAPAATSGCKSGSGRMTVTMRLLNK